MDFGKRRIKIIGATSLVIASLGVFAISQTGDANNKNVLAKPTNGIENSIQKTNPVEAIVEVTNDAITDAPATDTKEDTKVPEVSLPTGSVVLNTPTPKTSKLETKKVEDTTVTKAALPVESVVVNTPTQITKPVENKDTSSVDRAVADKAAASKAVATTVLTPEIITRLQSYPIHKVNPGSDQEKPALDFNQIMEKDPDLAAGIAQNIFKQFNVFKENEKFITSERCTYRTWHDHSVIRGILQTTGEDGKMTEQDVEYEYYYGGLDGPKFVFVEMRTLSGEKAVKK